MMDASAGPLDWNTYQTLGTATYYDNGGILDAIAAAGVVFPVRRRRARPDAPRQPGVKR